MTPDVIEGRLQAHLDEAERMLRLDVRQIVAGAAARGALTSSGTVLAKVSATDTALQRLVADGLSDAEAVSSSGGDEAAFYDALSTCLIQLKLRAGEIVKPTDTSLQGSARAIFENNIEEALNRARLAVRHHQQGFGRARTSANVAIHGSTNVIVQANSPGSQASITFNAASVEKAAVEVEAAIPWAEIDAGLAADLRGELATIRAQLSKRSPGGLVIRESGRTLRSLAENLAASAAYPTVLAAVQMLWVAAGLG